MFTLTKVCLHVIQLPLPVDAPLTNKVEVSEPFANVEEISCTNLSHLTHFIQYFPGFLLLKWWVQCLACISVIWAFFFATLKIFAHFWDLILKINCMLQTHLKLDQSQTVLKLFLFKILTCLMQATGTDRAAGYGMMLVSALIFVYYTIWVIFLVSCYPFCKFISLSDRLWLLSSLIFRFHSFGLLSYFGVIETFQEQKVFI